jgi:hypothetical protein
MPNGMLHRISFHLRQHGQDMMNETTYPWRIEQVEAPISKPVHCVKRADAEGSRREVYLTQLSAGIIGLEDMGCWIDRISRQEV